jgi:hypothetical protein
MARLAPVLALALAFALPVVATAEDAPDPMQAVHRALSVRHGPPSCAEVESLSPTPVETLMRMVDEVTHPPWVPMRAAECLARRHHAQVGPALQRWVTAQELKGLGLLVVGLLDHLPEPLAVDLATLALSEGPAPDAVRARLLRAERPALRRLAAPPADLEAP